MKIAGAAISQRILESFGFFLLGAPEAPLPDLVRVPWMRAREVTVYSRDNYGIPQFFLLKKSTKVIAGKITTSSFTVGASVPFYKISLSENNVIDIIDVKDSDNNKWYEVDYLAQDLIFTETEN